MRSAVSFNQWSGQPSIDFLRSGTFFTQSSITLTIEAHVYTSVLVDKLTYVHVPVRVFLLLHAKHIHIQVYSVATYMSEVKVEVGNTGTCIIVHIYMYRVFQLIWPIFH